ncbi:hypothetical protein E3N88_23642 [Mikania micrantha]|uniref:Longin domain-containing protein n=1 Tax=Mikania micrantha TaxID=192012 RepID=A0A5N6NDU9_9ASTR|nr:hypothetical protein E3N88_23642 [Mikania micrantha]
MTSSRYAMRRNTAFAIREGFRGFPACFVCRGTRYVFECSFAFLPLPNIDVAILHPTSSRRQAPSPTPCPPSFPYTDVSQTSIVAQCLQKLPATNKFTYNCDGHTFNYLVEGGFSKSDLI